MHAPSTPHRARSLVTLAVAALGVAACASGPRPVRPPAPNAEPDAGPAAAAHAAPESAELAHPLRVERLLPLVLERSPRVVAARARLEAAAQRRPQAVSLPDPMVEVRRFTRNAMAPGTSFPRYEVMLRQEFPFPTVIGLRGDAADRATEAEALRYEATVRDAVAELKDVHAERAYLAAAARVQAALRDVYRRYAELARADITTGRTRLPESFRAEALLAQAGYELTLLDELRGVEDQRLRALLALPRDVALGEPADTPPAADLDIDVEALTRRALEHNQELRAAGVDVASAEIGARLARWEWAPMFSVGASTMRNDAYDMATGATRDSTTVSLGFTLPLWAAGKDAAAREADANVRAARAVESGERERVAADVARMAFRLRNAARLEVLYGRDLVPQAEQALARSEVLVREGQESLASSLELAATWQQLRIAQLRAGADREQAAAALERVLGTSLDLVPSRPDGAQEDAR